MFQTFQDVFGSKFWANSIIDVSHSCDVRNRKKLEAWLQKLAHKFPAAADVLDSKVFVDAPEMENDTLEELYRLCRSKREFSCLEKHSSLEDLSVSLSLSQTSDCSTEDRLRLPDCLDSDHSRPLSRVESPVESRTSFNNSYDSSELRPGSRSSSLFLSVPSRVSRSELSLPLALPPLPPRSPNVSSRRRTLPSPASSSSCRSLTSTPRLSRAALPSFSPAEEFSLSPHLSRLSPLTTRRYSRESSPLSFSCRNSRDSSPSPPSRPPAYPTIGLPTYLRTSTAHKFPFTKAMRSGRLLTKMAVEEELELDFCSLSLPALPAHQQARESRVRREQELLLLPAQVITTETPGLTHQLTVSRPTSVLAGRSVEEPCQEWAASQEVNILQHEVITHFTPSTVQTVKARRTSEPKTELELFKPESLLARNPFTLIKKALLPRIKYHWDQGFSQGPNGWQKVPIVKLKVKYNEEDQELLPPSISVEGGRYCENKRVKLEGGRAKLKLKTAQVVDTDVQLRVVPLDKEGRQEAWVPEFLFTVLGQGGRQGEGREGDKWRRAVVTSAMPE